MIAHGSSGKIRKKIKSGNQVICVTAGQLDKIDFATANIAYILQHRLIFSPPPDFAQKKRNQGMDEFLDQSLPSAVQTFLKTFDLFALSKKPFCWAVLDSHFQKRGNFTDEFLRHLPVFPITRTEVKKMSEGIIDFLES